jgi:hypothetical protein
MNTQVTNLKAAAGFNRITDTATHTISADVIVALADTVIATLAGNNMKLNSVAVATLTSVSLTKGDILFGDFTSIELASGAVDCINKTK